MPTSGFAARGVHPVQDIKYRTRKEMMEVLRRGIRERKRDGLEESSSISFDFTGHRLTAISAFRPGDTKRPEFPSSSVVLGVTFNNCFAQLTSHPALSHLTSYFFFFSFFLKTAPNSRLETVRGRASNDERETRIQSEHRASRSSVGDSATYT